MEHTVLHLLYSRFWNQFLYDIGVVPTREPYKKRTSHGMILAEDGEKMSKSRGNVINPNEIVEKYGADVLRVYEMFMGPFDQAVPWSTKSIAGVERFLERVWQLGSKSSEVSKSSESSNIERLVHKTVKKVTEDIEEMKFNTAIAAMMSLVNELSKQDYILPSTYYILLQLLNPFAPHVTEELWEKFSKSSETSKSSESSKKLLAQQPWPQYDPALIKEETIELVVQVNGKVRDRIAAAADILEDEAKALAMGSEKVKKWLGGQKVKEVVFVKGKLINIVTS
ncbi:MAG: class I tRNA ligase family protein [bacterium]|nr:class I tRNA ligase family protein [bacterium]